jgi:sortase A
VTTQTAAEATPATGTEESQEHSPRPMSRARRVLDLTGRILVGLGVLVLLFTAYQIWGTSLQEAHTQSQLRSTLIKETNGQEIRHALAEAAALDKLPTGPPVTAPAMAPPPEGDPIGQITIPVIGVNQIVVEGTNTPDLRKGPGHYIGTPLPGEAGNVGVAGHRTTYGHPFYNLDSVKPGDPIVLTTTQGIFVYDAFRSFVISPNDSQVINNVSADWLTLTTCNPRFSATTRLVVQAKLAHSQLFANSGLAVAPTAGGHATPKSEQLAGDNGVDLAGALSWGLVALVLGALTLLAGRRFRSQRWLAWIVGTAGLLVLLYFFFGAVSPLLPASY